MGNRLAQWECWPIKPKRGKDVESKLAQQECWPVKPKTGKNVESRLAGPSTRKPTSNKEIKER